MGLSFDFNGGFIVMRLLGRGWIKRIRISLVCCVGICKKANCFGADKKKPAPFGAGRR
jgi:hypothetical protein